MQNIGCSFVSLLQKQLSLIHNKMVKVHEWSFDIRELLIEHYKEDKTERETIEMLKLPKSKIHKIICKYRQIGSVKNLPRVGRLRATSSQHDRIIHRKVFADHRISATQLVKDIKN